MGLMPTFSLFLGDEAVMDEESFECIEMQGPLRKWEKPQLWSAKKGILRIDVFLVSSNILVSRNIVIDNHEILFSRRKFISC